MMIRLIKSASTDRRPVGLAKGRFEVPPEFFEPLPDDLMDAFEGKALEAPADASPRSV